MAECKLRMWNWRCGWQGSVCRHSVCDGWHTSLRSNGFKLSTNTIGYLNAVARRRRASLRSCPFTLVQHVCNYSRITKFFPPVRPQSVHCKKYRLSLRSHSLPSVNAWLILCIEALQIAGNGRWTIPLLLHVTLPRWIMPTRFQRISIFSSVEHPKIKNSMITIAFAYFMRIYRCKCRRVRIN